jgi:5-methylcytosine-specific restriction endonuclease McrA
MAHNWHTSTRKSRLPGDWERRRKQQLAMQPICMICGVRESTAVDHIEPMTDRHEPEDLQSVCEPCHRQKTAREAAAFRAAARGPGRARPDERHPGLL